MSPVQDPGFRVGHGYDVHAFGAADAPDHDGRVWLAGVPVPSDRPVLAHSDGDLLAHALCDALLGAAALGDIGRHFPDDDSAWAGAAGETLVRACVAAVRTRGLAPVNADLTLVAQAPRVAPFVDAMAGSLAAWLELPRNRVNVKATTTERLGAVGRREGLAAHAVVLLGLLDP